MSDALRDALRGLRSRRGRAALTGMGIAMAAAMLAAAATVAYGLDTGFARGADAADLPDVIMRFQSTPAGAIASRIRALPDIAAYTLGNEVTDVPMSAGAHRSENGVVQAVGSGRRGYAIVAGHDISGAAPGAVLEQGVARSWGLRVGDTIEVGGYGPQRIAGLAQAPDDVAYPLAAPRVYLAREAPQGQAPAQGSPAVNLAEVWLRDPSQLDAVLVQARLLSYGLRELRYATRSGVRVLIDQAAGIVIALLAALSLMALLAAGVMLAASAHAELQRRLHGLGVRRALGASRAYVASVSALEALAVALPAAALGVGAGAAAASAPDDRLLALLNEPGPGGALALPLAGCFVAAVLLPVLAGVWPAWRAAGRPPVALLAGAELRPSAARASRGGLLRLGSRLVLARRVRMAGTLAVLGVSAAFVLLMLALASEIGALENDPAALGRRYQLTAELPASAAARVRRLPGVLAAAPRYELTAADSFSLDQSVTLIAYEGSHTEFEAPPLASGSRLRGNGQAEVGVGLAQVLGLSVGSTLALTLPSGRELRLRVAGVVDALDHDGRVAYVPATALLAGESTPPEQIAVRLTPGASASTVAAELGGTGVSTTQTVTGKGTALVSALGAVLRVVAAINGLVCLYTLVQALALTAHERRRTIAVLRACGAGGAAVRRLLAGAACAVAIPAALFAVLLERLVLGPAMGRIAAGYVSLSLAAGAGEVALVIVGLAVLGALAVWWVARGACRQTIVEGLA